LFSYDFEGREQIGEENQSGKSTKEERESVIHGIYISEGGDTNPDVFESSELYDDSEHGFKNILKLSGKAQADMAWVLVARVLNPFIITKSINDAMDEKLTIEEIEDFLNRGRMNSSLLDSLKQAQVLYEDFRKEMDFSCQSSHKSWQDIIRFFEKRYPDLSAEAKSVLLFLRNYILPLCLDNKGIYSKNALDLNSEAFSKLDAHRKLNLLCTYPINIKMLYSYFAKDFASVAELAEAFKNIKQTKFPTAMGTLEFKDGILRHTVRNEDFLAHLLNKFGRIMETPRGIKSIIDAFFRDENFGTNSSSNEPNYCATVLTKERIIELNNKFHKSLLIYDEDGLICLKNNNQGEESSSEPGVLYLEDLFKPKDGEEETPDWRTLISDGMEDPTFDEVVFTF
jgi:hypothetical protein